ncbi:histidine phosphatase family protein [Actinacidiphila rubida]|uniref:Broad specificity phosphatase PhoE n=1 Tax=Actinacidiphila rubida TaxID=310780 RepID=A0A1H8TKT0_9ACTN|nr:histidine phosphatase family protein [Actinacidiphila rubida]SEO91431.1 Broad specificity phosphatase PhoE [Actinacidiphila rubida]
MTQPLGYRCALRRLTVVRHGQSTANVVFAAAAETGDPAVAVPEPCDAVVPLSPDGVEQARAAGRWLGELAGDDRPTVVACSPYLRALQTWGTMADVARHLGASPGDALVDERLRDREMGVLELLTPSAVRDRAPDEAARRERVGDWHYRPPGGESMADVVVRVRDFVGELSAAAPEGAHVLLVSHDAVVLAMRQVLSGIGAPPPGAPLIPNASVSRWDGDGSRMRLAEFGGVTHLGGQ